jgi:inositol-phosphate transport system ATP-binding protein
MDVYLKHLTKKFGNTKAVDDLSLEIKSGEFVAFLGPSGCGKTTTLLMTAGIYRPDEGEIFFGDQDVTYMQPKDRNIGMVFQSYALYPHMNVYENIAFSMKLKKRPEDEMKKEVHEVADMLGIGNLLKRMPGELSGGQQQRVALGRALVKKPNLLLFDEPLSNLDARLRISMRSEIRRLQKDLGITCIYVTHDQIEAMTMADKVAVIKSGKLQTYEPPIKLHDEPKNLFIGQFVGNPPMNTWHTTLKEKDGTCHVVMPDGVLMKTNLTCSLPKDKDLVTGIRPEDIVIQDEPTEGTSSAEITLIEPLGRDNMLDCKCGSINFELLADPKKKLAVGDRIYFKANPTAWQIFDAATYESLLW